MQEWSENTDFLMYLTHIQGNSVISEKFVKTKKKLKSTQNGD